MTLPMNSFQTMGSSRGVTLLYKVSEAIAATTTTTKKNRFNATAADAYMSCSYRAMIMNVSVPNNNNSFDARTPTLKCHFLAHLVLAVTVCNALGIVRLQLVINCNVQITVLDVVGSAFELTLDVLAGFDGQNVCEVEDGLLPVRVLGVWASAEAHRFVAGGELDVKPRDQGVHVVGSADRDVVWKLE